MLDGTLFFVKSARYGIRAIACPDFFIQVREPAGRHCPYGAAKGTSLRYRYTFYVSKHIWNPFARKSSEKR